ncbi:hypothetical protein JD969_09275 [Planctomycetota bacterium]|nr:hypothetical protein JD969_09275 [Planctomycetota bacterium]
MSDGYYEDEDMNQKKSVTIVVMGMVLMMLGGCFTNPLRREPVAGTKRAESLASGYSLLKHIAGQEKEVGMITWVKSYEAEVEKLLSEVSDAAGELDKWLDSVEKALASNGVRMNAAGMPEVEVWARKWIETRTRKSILGGQKARSELVMVLSQAKGLEYMAALCEGIANIELSDKRRNKLQGFAKRFEELNERAIGLLAVRKKENKKVENFDFERKPMRDGYDEKP